MNSFIEAIAKNMRSIVAFLVIVFSFGFLYILMFKKLPEGNADTINLAAGIVLGVVATVCAYYFGSSKDKSDHEKAEIAKKQSESTSTSTTTITTGTGPGQQPKV